MSRGQLPTLRRKTHRLGAGVGRGVGGVGTKLALSDNRQPLVMTMGEAMLVQRMEHSKADAEQQP